MDDQNSRRRASARSLLLGGIAAAAIACTPLSAQAQDAKGIFKSMTDFLTGAKVISMTFDTDIEVLTDELQKIQFTSSGQVLLSRPDRLRATRTGGYTDVELVFDGKTVTVLGKHINAYAQRDVAGSVDQLIDRLREDLKVEMPGADLLLSRVFDELMGEVVDAKYIGQGVIDGKECEHLAFRTPEVDWQIWVEVGPRPIPRKYVITSKTLTGAPQYTLRIKDFRTDEAVAADAFQFRAPADAKKVDVAELKDIDEVPPGQVSGGKK